MRFTPIALCAAFAAAQALAATAIAAEGVTKQVAPATLPGAEPRVYRPLAPDSLRLHIFKPTGWKATDRRPAFVWFFGGGWERGTPANSVWWANWAASKGLVGVAPDYRVKDRFGTSPLEAVADGRAAVRWLQDHAAELGIDPQRIVVGGNSAGGHVALWTAIGHPPPGSDPNESPKFRPAALVLTSAVSDTSKASGYTPVRFGAHAQALSPVHQLDPKMPPMLLFHGDADQTVPHAQALALRLRLRATGNACELVSVPGGSHNYGGELKDWAPKTQALAAEFLKQQGLLEAAAK